MVAIHTSVRRARGRPQVRSDEETRLHILEAARRQFGEKGYAGTCMGDVAQRAGVSTKTLYRLIPTKTDLFANAVSDRIGRFMLEIDDRVLAELGLDKALEHILTVYGTLTLAPETIAINRLVIAECDRFPEIASAFYDGAVVRTGNAMEHWLRVQCGRGLLDLEDPHAASGMLRGMMILEPQRAVMMGQREAPDAEEIAQRARACTRLFLDGCRSRSGSSHRISGKSEPS
jgi:AcrR family transcriptional regulator